MLVIPNSEGGTVLSQWVLCWAALTTWRPRVVSRAAWIALRNN